MNPQIQKLIQEVALGMVDTGKAAKLLMSPHMGDDSSFPKVEYYCSQCDMCFTTNPNSPDTFATACPYCRKSGTMLLQDAKAKDTVVKESKSSARGWARARKSVQTDIEQHKGKAWTEDSSPKWDPATGEKVPPGKGLKVNRPDEPHPKNPPKVETKPKPKSPEGSMATIRRKGKGKSKGKSEVEEAKRGTMQAKALRMKMKGSGESAYKDFGKTGEGYRIHDETPEEKERRKAMGAERKKGEKQQGISLKQSRAEQEKLKSKVAQKARQSEEKRAERSSKPHIDVRRKNEKPVPVFTKKAPPRETTSFKKDTSESFLDEALAAFTSKSLAQNMKTALGPLQAGPLDDLKAVLTSTLYEDIR